MIIECPSCGFSGRVPSHVAAVPHHARCPKCQFRFEISVLATQNLDLMEGMARHDLRHDLTHPRLDPSSSSYEIEALTDSTLGDDDDPADDDWDDEWDGAIEPDDAPPPGVRPVELPAFLRKGAGVGTSRVQGVSSVAATWRYRLFQAWAVVFISWAALIGFRAVLATILREDDFVFSGAMIWPVASVVLLVTASAGLFLLMDLNHRLTTMVGPAMREVPSNPANGSTSHHGSIDQVVVKPGKLPTI